MNASDRLAALEPACTLDDALGFYDSLDPVRAEHITGAWPGRELATGHPMDGLLAASGWWGKRFDDVDSVHPLLFMTPGGEIFPVDPRRVPLGLADKVPASLVAKGSKALGVVKPALRTYKPRARLRNIEHRGVVSAAMIYDHLPIIDHFRQVDERTLLGCMDHRPSDRPYFFILQQYAQ